MTSQPTTLCKMSSWGSSAFYYEPRGNSILSHVLVLMTFHFAIDHHKFLGECVVNYSTPITTSGLPLPSLLH